MNTPATLLVGTGLEIEGRSFEPESAELADALARAHRDQLRPRCLCRAQGVPMYVARLGDGYIVKRMPQTGSDHAPHCPSFEPAASALGLSALLGSAIIEDPSTGATTLRLDFPLSVPLARTAPRGSASSSGTLMSRGGRLSLRSLLHFLWDQAGLTRWQPDLQGRRTWGLVRQQLLHAAEQKIASGAALTSRLYIPEAFCLEYKEQITSRRRMSWASAARRPGHAQQLLLMVAELKELAAGRHGFRAVMRHIPDVAFALDETLYRSSVIRFADELALWNASDEIRMVAVAAFGLDEAGLPSVLALYLMSVTRDWLPVETALEWQLVDRLVRERRAFARILRYDVQRDTPMPCVALIDCGDPAPLLFASPQTC